MLSGLELLGLALAVYQRSLLRLYGRPVKEALDAADTMVVSAQRSAGTLTEVIGAMVVAGGGSVSAEAQRRGKADLERPL
jgi:hypothetical protein